MCNTVSPALHSTQQHLPASTHTELFPSCVSFLLVSSRYESPEIALNCGIMLRECIRHEPLAKITLWSEQFYDFFRYVEMSTFDIASDAFATFKVSRLSWYYMLYAIAEMLYFTPCYFVDVVGFLRYDLSH